jgi:hypothetical protein
MSITDRPGTASIARRRTDHAVVLRTSGGFDEPLVDELRIQALEAHAPVVIDLDGCTSLDAAALRKLASAWPLYRPEMHLVCGAPGDRGLLALLDVPDPLPVHATVADALSTIAAASRS